MKKSFLSWEESEQVPILERIRPSVYHGKIQTKCLSWKESKCLSWKEVDLSLSMNKSRCFKKNKTNLIPMKIKI